MLLDAAADGRLYPAALASASASLLNAAASAVDGRLAECRAAMAAALGVAGDGGGLQRGVEVLVVRCMRLQRGSVVRVDDAMVQVCVLPGL